MALVIPYPAFMIPIGRPGPTPLLDYTVVVWRGIDDDASWSVCVCVGHTWFWDGGRKDAVFIAFLRASAPSACSATATATAPSSAWWSWWTWVGGSSRGAAHRGSPSSIFIDGGDCIGMRDVANAPPSSTLLRIFIQQIQPSPQSPPSIVIVIIFILVIGRRGRIGGRWGGHTGTSSRLFGSNGGASSGGRHR